MAQKFRTENTYRSFFAVIYFLGRRHAAIMRSHAERETLALVRSALKICIPLYPF